MNNYQPMYNFGMYGNRPNAYTYQGVQNMQQPIQPIQPIQPVQTIQPQQIMGLQGKSVDSVEVVKAMDIPLDGTVSYFPLTDGTAIVTKQLQQDGTSKTIIYKPVDQENIEKLPKYITQEDLDESLKQFEDSKNIGTEIKTMKREIEDICDDIKYLKNNNKNRKD